MMWPLQCSLLGATFLLDTKLIMKDSILIPEIANILIMALAAMTLNELMILKEDSNLENSTTTIMKLIGLIVILAFLTSSSMKFLMLMEATIYPLSYLILNSSKDGDKVESLKFMVVLNTLGSVPFMLYIGLSNIYFEANFVSTFIFSNSAYMMMMILFLIKTPIFMFHLWLTKVHVSASGNCSMILASIMIKMGTMGMYKFSESLKQKNLLYFFLCLALLTSIYFSTTMIRYFDAKTLIAMSSVLHMAMVTPMVMMKKSSTMMSSLMMMSAHGLISYFLFFLIALSYEKKENRTSIFIKSMESSVKMMVMMLVVFMFFNLGLPPFMNFLSETAFFISLKMFKNNLMLMIFGLSLILSVIFTMQANTNFLFSKSQNPSLKTLSSLLTMKFTFFAAWVSMILWFL